MLAALYSSVMLVVQKSPQIRAVKLKQGYILQAGKSRETSLLQQSMKLKLHHLEETSP